MEPSGPRSRKSNRRTSPDPKRHIRFAFLSPLPLSPPEVDGPAGHRSLAGPSCTGKRTLIGGRYVRAGEGILEASRQDTGRCALGSLPSARSQNLLGDPAGSLFGPGRGGDRDR